MNDYIIKTLFFHYMMFDLKGHIRSNRALYVYIFSSNNSSVKPLLSLYASLSFLSLSCSSLFFPPPPLPSTPYITLTEAADKKILLLTVSLLPSPSLTLSLCLSIFIPSLVLLLYFLFYTPPPLSLSYSLSMPLYLFSLISPNFL